MSLKRSNSSSADQLVPSDQELVRSIVSGDRPALVLLIRRYNQLLYRTARSILKDDSEAEDAVQEGLLLAYNGFANFRHDAKVSTWLVRIVANVAMGRLRKNVHRSELFPLRDNNRQKTQELGPDPPERPDEALSRADTRRLIEAKIDSLPDPYCVAFVLRAVQDLARLRVPVRRLLRQRFHAHWSPQSPLGYVCSPTESTVVVPARLGTEFT